MNKPKWIDEIAVIGWDLDGTLYPADPRLSELIEVKKRERLALEFGGDLAKAEAEYERIFEELGSNSKTLSALGIDGHEFFVELWDTIDLEEFIKPDPKLVEMFERLPVGRHFVLSNSNTREQIEKKLGLIGIPLSVFETIISTVEVGKNKPDPEPFEVAMERMKISTRDDPGMLNPGVGKRNVMYVGDKVRTDVVGAKGVGMRTCLVGDESEKADVCVPKIYDVLGLFNG